MIPYPVPLTGHLSPICEHFPKSMLILSQYSLRTKSFFLSKPHFCRLHKTAPLTTALFVYFLTLSFFGCQSETGRICRTPCQPPGAPPFCLRQPASAAKNTAGHQTGCVFRFTFTDRPCTSFLPQQAVPPSARNPAPHLPHTRPAQNEPPQDPPQQRTPHPPWATASPDPARRPRHCR